MLKGEKKEKKKGEKNEGGKKDKRETDMTRAFNRVKVDHGIEALQSSWDPLKPSVSDEF
jgi:hypothetical protein